MSNAIQHQKQIPQLRLGPKRGRYEARRIWGQGLMSSLPFVEFVLLAGFLMSASMFLSSETAYTTDARAVQTQVAPSP